MSTKCRHPTHKATDGRPFSNDVRAKKYIVQMSVGWPSKHLKVRSRTELYTPHGINNLLIKKGRFQSDLF